MGNHMKIILLGIASVSVAACGSVAEKATEIAIESATGSSLDVDLDTGDGSVTITDEETGEVIVGGIGSELPDGWPSDIPAPEGATLVSASSSSATGYFALWNWPNSTRAQFDDYVDGLINSGYAQDGEPIVVASSGLSISINLTGNGRTVFLNGIVDDANAGSLTIQARND